MTPNTLHRFIPIMKFHTDRNFICITAHRDEHKEEIQSYYKLTEEYMEEMTNEWHIEFLVLAKQKKLSDPDLIESPIVTREEYDGPSSSKKKKKEEVHKMNNASEETMPYSPEGGGGDKVNQEGV
jgi:hypothetical protein